MKTIAVASTKGGAGKTTVCSILAARASVDFTKVAMIDLNADQGNLTQWWMARGEPTNPAILPDVEDLRADVAMLAEEGYQWLFIDTPPLSMNTIESAVMHADAVIIPVRASLFDVSSIDAIVDMCQKHRKPHAFVLSAVDAKMPKLVEQANAALVSLAPVMATRVSYRMPYIHALTAGKAGHEIDRSLVGEVDALWTEVQRIATPVRIGGRIGGRR